MLQCSQILFILSLINVVVIVYGAKLITKEKYKDILNLRAHNSKKNGRIEKVYLKRPLTISSFIGNRKKIDDEYFEKEFFASPLLNHPEGTEKSPHELERTDSSICCLNASSNSDNDPIISNPRIKDEEELDLLGTAKDTSKLGQAATTSLPATLIPYALTSSSTPLMTFPAQPMISDAKPIPNYNNEEDRSINNITTNDNFNSSLLPNTMPFSEASNRDIPSYIDINSSRSDTNNTRDTNDTKESSPYSLLSNSFPLTDSSKSNLKSLFNSTSQPALNVTVTITVNRVNSNPTNETAKKDQVSYLINNLQQDVLGIWDYKNYLQSSSDLMLDQGLINRAKLSVSSGKRLKNLFQVAMKGQNINTAVITSSISQAFLNDPPSKRWLYPNALVQWWEKVVAPITGSHMILRDVSIAGVGVDYFARCLKAHLPDNGEYNLILWELSGSDYKPTGKLKPVDARSLELFLRTTLEYKSNPEVVLLNFFSGNHLNKSAYCRELDEDSETSLAKHYDCTALSWSKSICPYLSDDEEGFSFSYLFSRDRVHPSIIGHAQMAYILIDYIRDEFLKFLQDTEKIEIRSLVPEPLPPPIYAAAYGALCFSKLKASGDPPDADNSNLPVIFISPEPYENAAHRSKIGNYQYKPTIKPIIVRFSIPGNITETQNRTVAIMPFFSQPLRTMVRIDNQPFIRLKLTKRSKGKVIQLDDPVTLTGGDHMIRFWSLDKKFQLLALTIDEQSTKIIK